MGDCHGICIRECFVREYVFVSETSKKTLRSSYGKLLPGALTPDLRKHLKSRVSLAISNDLQFNKISVLHMNTANCELLRTAKYSIGFGTKMGIFLHLVFI